MKRSRTSRLGGYAALCAAPLLASLVLRRPELVALAAPFALWLIVGLSTAAAPRLDVTVALERDRAVEGDEVELEVRVRATATVEHLEFELVLGDGLERVTGTDPAVLRLDAGARHTARQRLHCRRWGAHLVGETRVRVQDRFGLLAFDLHLDPRLPLKVHPRPEPLRALVRPFHTQRLVGDQVARQGGGGVEFAEVRPLVPGDQVRHVNWRASARRGELYVNEHHPERNTDVVLFLDTFSEAGDDQGSTLDLAVRATASLSSRYLAAKDRVGLVSFGGYLHWLYPESSLTQAYRIVDSLLDTQIVASWADKRVEAIPVRMLPAGALVLGVTPLLDERGVHALLDLRARGFEVAILALSAASFVRPGPGRPAELAYRLWLLQREALRASYQRLGVAVAEWRVDEPLEAALGEVRTFQRRLHRARG